jgi:hypothetical protein
MIASALLAVWITREGAAPKGRDAAAVPTALPPEMPAIEALVAPLDTALARQSGSDEVAAEEPPGPPPDDPDMAPWGPWRKIRLEEIDGALQTVRLGERVRSRQLDLQYLVIACVAPLADEMGLSDPGSQADWSPAASDELVFACNQNYYRIPKGTFPLLDDFFRIWNEREKRRAQLRGAEASGFDTTEPWPLELFSMQDLEALAERAKAAIKRRSEPY